MKKILDWLCDAGLILVCYGHSAAFVGWLPLGLAACVSSTFAHSELFRQIAVGVAWVVAGGIFGGSALAAVTGGLGALCYRDKDASAASAGRADGQSGDSADA